MTFGPLATDISPRLTADKLVYLCAGNLGSNLWRIPNNGAWRSAKYSDVLFNATIGSKMENSGLSMPQITSVFSLSDSKTVTREDSIVNSKSLKISYQNLNHTDEPKDINVKSESERDILGEEDAAAIAACLDPSLSLVNENSDTKNPDIATALPKDAQASMNKSQNSVKDSPLDGNTGNGSEVMDDPAQPKAKYTSKSILPEGMREKLAPKRSKKSRKEDNIDPTYVIDSSGDSSDEFIEPIKKRLRRAPKKRSVGVIDTFTQHLETRRPRGRRSKQDIKDSDDSMPAAKKPSGNIIVTDTPADVNLSHDERMKQKERNIEQLKDLIRQQEEAIEKIRTEKAAKEAVSSRVQQTFGTSSRKDKETGKLVVADLRSKPILLPKLVSMVSNGIRHPGQGNALSPAITSLNVSPGSKLIRIFTHGGTATTQTHSNVVTSPKPLLIKGSHTVGSTVKPLIGNSLANKAPPSALLPAGKYAQLRPRPPTAPILANGSNVIPVQPSAASPSVLKTPVRYPIAPASSTVQTTNASNVNLIRLPTSPQSTGNVPGVFLNIPIPNSTGHQLLFFPTQLGNTSISTTASKPTTPNVQPLVNSNHQVVMVPLQQQTQGISSPPTVLRKPGSGGGSPAITPKVDVSSIATDTSQLTRGGISRDLRTENPNSIVVLNLPETNIRSQVVTPSGSIQTPLSQIIDTTPKIAKLTSDQILTPKCSSVHSLGASYLGDSLSSRKTPSIKEDTRLCNPLEGMKKVTETVPATKDYEGSTGKSTSSSGSFILHPSLMEAKKALKNALNINTPATDANDNSRSSFNTLSNLKNALKSAFSSDALKSSQPISKNLEDNKLSATVKDEAVKLDSNLNTADPLPDTIKRETQDSSPMQIATDTVSSTISSSSSVSQPPASEVASQSFTKPRILRNSSVKAKIMSCNGEYVSTSIGLENAVTSASTKQSNITISKKPPQQLSGILVKLKDGGVRFVKLPEQGGVDAGKLDPLRPKAPSLEEAKAILANSISTPVATSCRPSTVTSFPSMGISPLAAHVVAFNSNARPIPAVSLSGSSSSPLLASATPLTSIVHKMPQNVMMSGNVPSMSMIDASLSMLPSQTIPITTTASSDNKVAIFDHRTLDGAFAPSDSFRTPNIILPTRSAEGNRKVGITLGKQEKLIQLENRTKASCNFVPCADEFDFSCLTGLESVIDLIAERNEIAEKQR